MMFLNPTYNHGKSKEWEDLFNKALELKKEDMFNQHISFESEDFYDLYNRSVEELKDIINDYETIFKLEKDKSESISLQSSKKKVHTFSR